MSTTPLLPQAFWFRLALPCRRVAPPPAAATARGRGRLVDLPASCTLAGAAALNGAEPWAEVRAGWSPEGLAFQVEAEGDLPALAAGEEAVRYGVQLWVDTRDTRDVSRATRFCHRFDARLVPTGGRNGLGVALQQRPIARALADAPTAPEGAALARAERSKGRWRVEVFLSQAALHGYDPETNRRLGFTYQINDPARGDLFLGVGREFPVGENPSLWSTLELRDDD